jgi:hypothetical protein
MSDYGLFKMKKKVKLNGVRPEMVLAAIAASEALGEVDSKADCVITSACDSKHGRGSLHYVGQALDFRTRHLTREQEAEWASLLQVNLSDEFDVVLEEDHLHVEFQPK